MNEKTNESIAKFISGLTFDAIPKKAVDLAKDAILDWMGVTIAGSCEPAVNILTEQVKQWGGANEAGVIGRAFRTTAPLAAWINGTASHAIDYDDTFSNAAGYNFHPTVPVLPAVLALSEKCKASARAVLAAYIVGIEVESRVGAAMGRFSSEMGWHPTPVIGTIGAVAASANLLGLSAEQVKMALGIAGSHSSGFVKNFGTMTKPLHAGNAAKNGVIAALLAQNGFTGTEKVLEGDTGFCSMFSAKKANEVAPYDEDLGEVWHIITPGIALKAYPCCRSTHSCIDASLYLKNVMHIDPKRVVKIICKTHPQHTNLARFHRPASAYEGKFSIPYCIAVALLRGKVVLEDFTEGKVSAPEAQALLSRVEFLYPEKYAKGPMTLAQEIMVKLDNGEEYSYEVPGPKGDPENPLTHEELAEKFIDCTRLSFSEEDIGKTLKMIEELESLDDMSRLMDIVTHPMKRSEVLK
ncbi:MAG TPA: MmgE/PrpD family protein [Syntrophorhabdaceae bacterium]|nr:MmgE/PrpD family protein [Syntrophorhabdaceae bacterium]HQM81939.1 MmgE/PrpD family protein [Syntrophorhabdaceae bacterium]